MFIEILFGLDFYFENYFRKVFFFVLFRFGVVEELQLQQINILYPKAQSKICGEVMPHTQQEDFASFA